MKGLILKTETLPDGAILIGDVDWYGMEWYKIKGTFDQSYSDNYKKMKGLSGERRIDVFADPMDVIKALPDETITEIRMLSDDQSASKADRGKAFKIMSILGQSIPLEISGDEFQGYINWVKSNNAISSFKENEHESLKSKLKIG